VLVLEVLELRGVAEQLTQSRLGVLGPQHCGGGVEPQIAVYAEQRGGANLQV